MNKCSPKSIDVIKAETDIVRKMIQDECWYEGERKNREISDKEVEERINKLVFNNGEQIRDDVVNKLKNDMCKKMKNDCSNCPYHIS